MKTLLEEDTKRLLWEVGIAHMGFSKQSAYHCLSQVADIRLHLSFQEVGIEFHLWVVDTSQMSTSMETVIYPVTLVEGRIPLIQAGITIATFGFSSRYPSANEPMPVQSYPTAPTASVSHFVPSLA